MRDFILGHTTENIVLHVHVFVRVDSLLTFANSIDGPTNWSFQMIVPEEDRGSNHILIIKSTLVFCLLEV